MTGSPVRLFDPLRIRGVEFANRVVVSPMCMYSATPGGRATPWHLVHLGSRAAGGAGTVFTEATAVSAAGRITDGDLGLWDDSQIEGLASIAQVLAAEGSIPAIQLAHAGRKGGRTVPWAGYEPIPRDIWGDLLAPSAIPFREDWSLPTPMTDGHIAEIVRDFAASASRAVDAGFQAIELHFGHGYLVHQFLSPLSNHRDDAYGGALRHRARFAEEIVSAVRVVVGPDFPVFVRLSVVDWAPGGLSLENSIEVSRVLLDAGADLIDCSSGAVVSGEHVPVAPGYQVEFARRIRAEANVLTGAVGLITEAADADSVIAAGAADLVFIGRGMLRDPYWTRRAARQLEAVNRMPLPLPYRRAVERMDRLTQW